MGYWSPSWWAARLPACGLEAGSRVAVVASPVHTGRGSAGGLPGAPCHCALRVQATADRPPPVSKTRLHSLFRRLLWRLRLLSDGAPATLVSQPASANQSALAGHRALLTGLAFDIGLHPREGYRGRLAQHRRNWLLQLRNRHGIVHRGRQKTGKRRGVHAMEAALLGARWARQTHAMVVSPHRTLE